MWRKSSYSADSANCVEWRKSTRSQVTEVCVEVGFRSGALVRDSKDPDGPVLSFDASTWRQFIGWVADAR